MRRHSREADYLSEEGSLRIGGKQDRKLGPWRFWDVRDTATAEEQAAIVAERPQGQTRKHAARLTHPSKVRDARRKLRHRLKAVAAEARRVAEAEKRRTQGL